MSQKHKIIAIALLGALGWALAAAGLDPDTWLDRAVHATRTAVFPLHGMDPFP